ARPFSNSAALLTSSVNGYGKRFINSPAGKAGLSDCTTGYKSGYPLRRNSAQASIPFGKIANHFCVPTCFLWVASTALHFTVTFDTAGEFSESPGATGVFVEAI